VTGPSPGQLGTLPRGPLGDTETRLRNALEQEGPLPLSLDYRILPVVLVGDATGPGMGERRGRRFMARLGTSTGVANVSGIQAITEDVVIDLIQFTVDTQVGITGVELVIGSIQPTLAFAVVSGKLFLDRPLSATDAPGIQAGAVAFATFAPAPVTVGLLKVPVNGATQDIRLFSVPFGPDGFLLAKGATIGLRPTGGNTLDGVVFGRSF